MSLRPRDAPATQAKGDSRLDFVLLVGQRQVEDVGVLPRKGGPRSDFDKFTNTNEARLYRERVARARAANEARHRAAMEAAAAADAQANEALDSDEPQWLQDAAAAVEAAPARPTRAEAGVQTAPEQEARERIERNETELLASVSLQVNLRDDGADILREVQQQVKADGTQLEKMHGTIDRLRVQRDRMVAVLEDLVAQGLKDRQKIALVEETIANTQTMIDTLAKNFDQFMKESATIVKDSIRDLLEGRLQALENNCIDEVAKQTDEIKKLREQISRMADKDVVGEIMERVAKRREDEAEEMRRVLSLINPEKFADELFLAIQANDMEKCKLLLGYGADPYRMLMADRYYSNGMLVLESAFYGNLKLKDFVSSSLITYKIKLNDGAIDERVQILKLLADNKFTLAKVYNDLMMVNDFQPKVRFEVVLDAIPSKLLIGALDAKVLRNEEELLFNKVEFFIGNGTRFGTTPLYLFGKRLLDVRAHSKKPLKTDIAPTYNAKLKKDYQELQRRQGEMTKYFTKMLEGGFRDSGLHSLLKYIANGADVIAWKENSAWNDKRWEWIMAGEHRSAALGRITLYKGTSVEAARDLLKIMDEELKKVGNGL